MKKKLDKLGMCLLNIIIIIFSLIIGANEKKLRVLPITILLLLIIIFLICKKIINKKESIIFKNKIDITVFIFIISTFLPLLFKTYSSFSYEIEFILKYMFYYGIYILARNVIKTKKDINTIYRTIIFTSLIPIVLGITKNNYVVNQIIKFLNLNYEYNYKDSYTVGNANTMAIYMSMCIFLSLYKLNNTKIRKEKVIYIFYIIIAIYILYSTYSRMVMLLFLIFLCIFFTAKYKSKIIKNKKKIIITTTIFLIVFIPLFSHCLKVSSPVYTESSKYEKVINYNFKKNKKYKLKLNIDFINYNNSAINPNDKNYNIKLVSINKYYKEKEVLSKYYENGHKEIVYEITPDKNTEYFRIYIYSRVGAVQINKIFIDDEEYIINYKYLPEKIGKAIVFFNLKDKSILERIEFHKCSLKIFKRHILFGNGGNAWRSLSNVYQSYTYSMKETHSYILEVLISYGLIGIITYFVMLVNICIELIKNKKKKEMNILLYVLGILLLHSLTFDFNMSFMFIQILTYTLFACVLSNTKNSKLINQKYDYPVLILLVITLVTYSYITLYQYSIVNYYIPINRNIINKRIENLEKEKISSEKKLDILMNTMKNEPYYSQNYFYNLYFNILINDIESISNTNSDKYFKFIIKQLHNIESSDPLYPNAVYSKEKIIYDNIKRMEDINCNKKYLKELKRIFIRDYKINIKIMNDSERIIYDDSELKQIKRDYKTMYEEVR